jgi:hypothetical protein
MGSSRLYWDPSGPSKSPLGLVQGLRKQKPGFLSSCIDEVTDHINEHHKLAFQGRTIKPQGRSFEPSVGKFHMFL